MLIRFTVENFMSFRDKTEFNMLTGDVRRHKNHVKEVGGVEVLRAAAIYGANGSGKSNLVKALLMFTYLFKTDGSLEGDFSHKLDDACTEKPSIFLAEFFVDGTIYEFGIEFKKLLITKEWMNRIDHVDTDTKTWVYSRTTFESVTELHVNTFLYPHKDVILKTSIIQDNFTEPSKLILHTLKGKGFIDIDNIVHSIAILVISESVGQEMKEGWLLNLLNSIPTVFETVNQEIALADIGLKKIAIKEYTLTEYLGVNDNALVPKIDEQVNQLKGYYDLSKDSNWAIAVKEKNVTVVKSLKFYHAKKNSELVEFAPGDESEGTLVTLALLFALNAITSVNNLVIIDEIEKSIHPLLIKKLLEKFMSQDIVKGQLIFTTHDSDLLDLNIFRQDEIWFTEKSKDGATSIYPLTEYNPRYDLDIRKGYLTGRFGAIPFLGRLDDLDWNKPEPKTA